MTHAMSKRRSLDGIVTAAWGKTDFLPDGSYVTTQWLALFMIPIIPLASFRVIKSKRYPEHARVCEKTSLNLQADRLGLPLCRLLRLLAAVRSSVFKRAFIERRRLGLYDGPVVRAARSAHLAMARQEERAEQSSQPVHARSPTFAPPGPRDRRAEESGTSAQSSPGPSFATAGGGAAVQTSHLPSP